MNFAVALATKDVRLAVELGKELGVPLELGPVVEAAFTRFCESGHASDDQMAFMRSFLRRSGVDVPEPE